MTSVASSRMRVAVVLTLCIVVTASPRSRIVRSMCFAGSHQPCSSAYCTSSALETSGPCACSIESAAGASTAPLSSALCAGALSPASAVSVNQGSMCVAELSVGGRVRLL